MSEPGDWTPELTIVGSKITGYLLNLDHRVGRHKAAWFIARGFQVEFEMSLTAELFDVRDGDARSIRARRSHCAGRRTRDPDYLVAAQATASA
jgi:hypothetical protein